MADTETSAGLFEAIRRRRVARAFSPQPVERALLQRLAEAGRWAPSAGNRRIHIFVAVDNPALVRKLRLLAPGMLGEPPALVAICTDWRRAREAGVKSEELNTWVDLGAAMQNMLLTAYELGLGAGPVTSFSRSGVQALLHLPPEVRPELLVCVGYPLPQPRLKRQGAQAPVSAAELTFWNYYDDQNRD
jgi:nitroreductase